MELRAWIENVAVTTTNEMNSKALLPIHKGLSNYKHYWQHNIKDTIEFFLGYIQQEAVLAPYHYGNID